MASDFLQRLTGQQADSSSLLARVVGSREGCFFDRGSISVDVSVVCHEARNLDVGHGEQTYVSVRDMRRREGEAFAQLGGLCNLRTLERDTTLLVRVWVDEVSGTATNRPSSGERRVLGEVRIPLTRLATQYNECFYHTWLTLDSPGLQDSVASMGIGDVGSELDQAIEQGPKQLSQPKICLSMCKTADVPPSGKMLWDPDASTELRAAGWGPLLRSQKQHVVLSTALHLKCERQAALSEQTQELHERNRAQSEAIQRLEAQLEDAHSQLQQQQLQLQQSQQQPTPRPTNNSLFNTQPSLPHQHDTDNAPTARPRQEVHGPNGQLSITQARSSAYTSGDSQAQAQLQRRLAEAEDRLRAQSEETERVRRECDTQRVEAESLRGELDTLSLEANRKIEAGNDRIRTLRHRKDEAEQELQQLKSSTIPLLTEEKATLESENRQLAEQKEALLRIVEDLHQTCVAAGLNTAGRQSIDNMTCTITQELRLN